MNKNSEKVISQFFQPFYDERINQIKNYTDIHNRLLDIPIALFWFSVIDFYGGLYYVGLNNKVKLCRDGSIKLASQESFEKFIEDFFPIPENRFGKLLYKVFRSGIVHQISPKSAGICFECDSRKLFIVRNSSNISDNNISDIGISINLFRLQELAYDSYNNFKGKIIENQLFDVSKNICNRLITNDIFDDKKVLDKQYELLNNEQKEYLFE